MASTHFQSRIIDITQKSGSALSVIGEIFVITTFLFGNKFRKPINRLVFYAAWGNVFSNVATLIGRSGINMGLDTPLCQFQAFLIQWFMPADALWTFAMACNVWLSFFNHYDTPKLRSLEWKYLVLCYTTPFIPAFIFLFVTTKSMGRVYGDAQLWCWIDTDWDFLRVGIFYAPVWIIIILIIGIYFRVGFVILRWRQQLSALGKHPEQKRCEGRPSTPTTIQGIRRTDEVTVTVTDEPNPGSTNRTYAQGPLSRNSDGKLEKSVPHRLLSAVRFTAQHSHSRGSKGTFKAASTQANKAALKYFKCALLFFVALFVTWVPSSINRIYTLAHPEHDIFGLQFAAALVLPLQGFWNSVIYVATSGYACKSLWRDFLRCFRARRPSLILPVPLKWSTHIWNPGNASDRRAESDTNSLRPGGVA